MAAYGGLPRAAPIAALALTLAGLWVASGLASAATAGYPEDAIEAAFLYRFADFVSWPPTAGARRQFTIAVLDDDTLAEDLERMPPQGALKGRRVRIRRITDIGAARDAQILYIGPEHANILRQRLALIAGRPILIVTRQPGGLDDGSIINFLLLHRHVRFEISLVAARRAGLRISADLLSVAERVEGRVPQ
jgi:hypothetical protein